MTHETGTRQPAPHGGVMPETDHEIGIQGEVVIETVSDDVRVRGIEGTVARIVGPADLRKVAIEREPGSLAIRTGRWPGGIVLGLRIGSFGFGGSAGGTIEVEVPRSARVDISSATGDIAVRDVLGGIRVRTASGDAALRGVGGTIRFQGASGNLEVVAAGPLRLEAETMSGDVELDAPRLLATSIRTISGDIELAAAFDRAGSHTLESTSGDVEIALSGGATLDIRTISGDVDVSHPDGKPRRKREPVVIGDGAATMAVRTLSGDIEIRRGRPAPLTPSMPMPTMPGSSVAPNAPTAPVPPIAPGGPVPPIPAMPPAPPAPPLSPLDTTVPIRPVVPAVPLSDAIPGGAGPGDATPSAMPGAAAGDPATEATEATEAAAVTQADPVVAILEALARGDIDVDEAERRIAGAGANGGPGDA